jgi:DNA-binding SARP family transcriptional activator/predicted ATPase
MAEGLHTDTPLRIQLLGGFSVSRDGNPLTGFESERVRALLAYLAVEASRPIQRGFLAGTFWPDHAERRARQNLSQALYNLRNLLGDREAPDPYLIVTKNILQFNASSHHLVDVTEFVTLLSRCKHHDHQDIVGCDSCLVWLENALELYQGEFLAGFSLSDSSAFDEWCLVTRERLHRQVLWAAHALVDHLEKRGEYQRALDHAWHLVEWDPYGESAMGALLRLLVANDQHNLALTKYREFQRLLADELDVEPSQELNTLFQRLRTEAAVRSGVEAARHNLPPSLTPFVGRKWETKELARRLVSENVRLLSLIGPGGSGKTSLALYTARSLLEGFPHGVCYVPLGSIESADGITAAVGEGLGISFQPGLRHEKQILDYLRDKHLLLILDGFEHVLKGVSHVEKILRSAPGVKVLVTSRVRLNTKYEVRYTLSGLGVPAPSAEPSAALASESVQLFLGAAMRAQVGFTLSDGSLGDVVEICRLVQGMPLGILLASAWVALFTPAEIAARIRENLDFLVVDWQDLPARLRSLRATFNYSWDFLSERQRRTLKSLAVFRGGFTLQAAQKVTGCTARELMALMDRSLLHRTLTGRFEVHELVRQYAAERLARRVSGEMEVRDRHCAYYLGLLKRRGPDLRSARQAETLASLDPEKDNLRTAWRWAVDNSRFDLIKTAMDGLCLFEELRWRYQEGEQACQSVIQKATDLAEGEAVLTVRVRALAWQFYLDGCRHQIDRAQSRWEQLREVMAMAEVKGLGVRWERALAWLGRGLIRNELLDQGDDLHRSLDLFRDLGEDWWAARVLMRRGVNYSRQGSYSLAIRMHEDSLAIRREIGEPGEIADTLRQLSFAHAFYGRLELAMGLMEEAAEQYKSLGTLYGEASASRYLGMINGWLGRFAEAGALLGESLPIYQRIGLRLDEVTVYYARSLMKMHLGEIDSARKDAQIALNAARQLGTGREIAVSLLVIGLLDLVGGQPDRALANIEEGVAIYREMGYNNELDYGLTCLGLALREVGEDQAAREALRESLELVRRRGGGYLALWLGLPLAALLLLDEGELEQALEVWVTARQIPLVANSLWVEKIAGRPILAATEALPDDRWEAAEARAEGNDPFQLVGWLLDKPVCQPDS